MGLYQRLTDPNSRLTVHRFGAALREWAGGGLTRAEVIAMFSLVNDEVTELDALAATYQALPQNNTANTLVKAAYLDRMEDVFLLVETGDYDEAKARARLGF